MRILLVTLLLLGAAGVAWWLLDRDAAPSTDPDLFEAYEKGAEPASPAPAPEPVEPPVSAPTSPEFEMPSARVVVADEDAPPPRLPPEEVKAADWRLRRLRVEIHGRLSGADLLDALTKAAWVRVSSEHDIATLRAIEVDPEEFGDQEALELPDILLIWEKAGFEVRHHPGIFVLVDRRPHEREEDPGPVDGE